MSDHISPENSTTVCSYSRKEALVPVRRWTPYRKFFLLEAVSRGLLTRAEAHAAHGISDEEWSQWTLDLEKFGAGALRATMTQAYRRTAP
jgi:Protein of unknown function (DUF1153)